MSGIAVNNTDITKIMPRTLRPLVRSLPKKAKKYKLSIDEWDGHAQCQTPVNSQYTNPNVMSCRHNPPSIVSISRSTTNCNQLSLQHQQLNRLHHPISPRMGTSHRQMQQLQQNNLNHRGRHRGKTPSMLTQTTMTSMQTVQTVQTMNTFKRIESVQHEDEDEFLSYHQTPSNRNMFNNKSRMSHSMSNITQITPRMSKTGHGGQRMASTIMSSTMPLSVNSPSNSGSLDSTMTDTLSNTTDMSSIQLTARHYDAHIPQFHGDSPVMAPLHETETSECEKLREIKLKDRRGGGRKDTHDTNSTDIFASTTVNTAITSVSATTRGARNSNSNDDDGSNATSSSNSNLFSTTNSNSSPSTSTQLLSSKGDSNANTKSNSKCDHPHHHSDHGHLCKDKMKMKQDGNDDESGSEKDEEEEINNHGFVAGIQGMFNSGFNRIRGMVHYDNHQHEEEEGSSDEDAVQHGVVDVNDNHKQSKVKTGKL